MSKDKEIINKLFKVVAQQQQIITKLAQQASVGSPAAIPPPSAAQVQADIVDALYGKGSKMVPGKTYPQVHYAKSAGGQLLIGVSIPPGIAAKWEAMKAMLAGALTRKYGAGEVVWRE